MALEPATVIKRFPNRDPIEPGFERTSLAKLFMPLKALRKTSWVPSAASEGSANMLRMRLKTGA